MLIGIESKLAQKKKWSVRLTIYTSNK